MMFLILFLTALTASGVNLFMREIEFQEFTARVSKAKKSKDDTMWKKTHLYFASFEDPYTNPPPLLLSSLSLAFPLRTNHNPVSLVLSMITLTPNSNSNPNP